MNEKILQEKLNSKLPNIQQLFAGGEHPIKIVREGQGFIVKDTQGIIELTDTQLQGLQIYINLTKIIDIDGLTKETTSSNSNRDSGTR